MVAVRAMLVVWLCLGSAAAAPPPDPKPVSWATVVKAERTARAGLRLHLKKRYRAALKQYELAWKEPASGGQARPVARTPSATMAAAPVRPE